MKKLIKKYIKYTMILLIILFVLKPTNSVAMNEEASKYYIKYLDYYMTVNEDNTFDITEVVTVKYTKPTQEINLDLPEHNEREQKGKIVTSKAKIKNLEVSEPYTLKEKGYDKIITIKNNKPDELVEHLYKIQYTYDAGEDPIKGADELYYSLVGYRGAVVIKNVYFNITMPKSFDTSKIGFLYGEYDHRVNPNVTYNVNGTVIEGTVNTTLEPYQGLTIKTTLPQGYFNRTSQFDKQSIIMMCICSVCMLITFFVWLKYGKDDNKVENVEFYPPQGLNPLEMQYLYDGKPSKKGVVSLLLHLANKGYIQIEKVENEARPDKYRIIKLKEYAGNNIYEKIFFNGLFRKERKTMDIFAAGRLYNSAKAKTLNLFSNKASDVVLDSYEKNEEKESVGLTDLYLNFYTTIENIQETINSNKNQKSIFEGKSLKAKILPIIFIISIIVLTAITITKQFDGTAALLTTTIQLIIVWTIGRIIHDLKLEIKGKITQVLYILIVLPLFYSMRYVVPQMTKEYMIMFIATILSLVVIKFFKEMMIKRTPEGNEIYKKTKGFIKFLETANKNDLDRFISNNPNYFYDILPYAYALQISDKWINKFSLTSYESPSWYNGSESFTTFVSNGMMKIQEKMEEAPSYGRGRI